MNEEFRMLSGFHVIYIFFFIKPGKMTSASLCSYFSADLSLKVFFILFLS